MMAAAACISCASSHPRSPSLPPPSTSSLSFPPRAPNWARTIVIHTLASSLSLTLSFSSPAVPALSSSTSSCQEQQQLLGESASTSPAATGPVTNEEIVEEAWQVVEDSFFDARLNHWSPDEWKEMRGFVLDRTIKTRSKAHDLIRRMLATLDDHYTRFLTPSEKYHLYVGFVMSLCGEKFAKMAKYDVTGIGINLRELPNEDGTVKVRVLGIVLDGPAHVAGVRQGDEVLAVNGEDVRGKSAFEVSSLLQGPKETYVTLEVKHGNCGPVESFKVQRQVMVRTPVYYKLEQAENGESSVGYIRLKEFNALARKDLLIAMKRLQASGATCFILDLRDNLGGLVQAGIEVAKLFLEEGETVTYTVGKDAQYQNNIVSDSMPLTRAPLAVLVNNRTASASEIVATALHDNCRAVLVGERTFGKGLIQSVFELRDGSGIVVTVGKYVTPNHQDINGNGVDPDFANLPDWAEIKDHLMQCHKQRDGYSFPNL